MHEGEGSSEGTASTQPSQGQEDSAQRRLSAKVSRVVLVIGGCLVALGLLGDRLVTALVGPRRAIAVQLCRLKTLAAPLDTRHDPWGQLYLGQPGIAWRSLGPNGLLEGPEGDDIMVDASFRSDEGVGAASAAGWLALLLDLALIGGASLMLAAKLGDLEPKGQGTPAVELRRAARRALFPAGLLSMVFWSHVSSPGASLLAAPLGALRREVMVPAPLAFGLSLYAFFGCAIFMARKLREPEAASDPA